MQQLNPSEISALIKQRISDLNATAEARNEGTVVKVSDGIVRIHGLADVMYGEMIEFEGGLFGMALNLEQDSVGAVVLGGYLDLQEGQKVRCTGRILEVPVGPEMLGRVVDALGKPIDGKGPITNVAERRRVDVKAPGIIPRKSVHEPVQTGLKAIDIRNRALLLVLFELGLTSAEIRALTVESFVDGGAGKGASIRITSGGVNQLRTMVVSDEVRSAIKSWLQVKATAGKHALAPALFSSQTGKPMTDENLLVLVRAHLLAASRAAGQDDPVRAGPQIVRNTRLVQWMWSGMPQPDVALRAGLKNVRGLLHLRQHLPDGPRLELAREASRKDDEPLRPVLQRLA